MPQDVGGFKMIEKPSHRTDVADRTYALVRAPKSCFFQSHD